jgi:chitodextrinase
MKRKTIIIAGFLALVFTVGLSAQAPPRPGQSRNPDPPNNIRTSNISHEQATVQWDSAGQGLTYKVYYNTSNSANGARSVDVNGTSYTITGLNANTNYWIFVSTLRNKDESNLSAAVNFRTANPPPPPAPPTPGNLRSSTVSHEQASITWDDIRGRRVNYKVYYNTQNNSRNAQSVNSSTNSTSLSGLQANTNYWVWVSAVDGNQESPLSSAVTFRTAAPPAPPAPANVRSSNITDTQATIAWDSAGRGVSYTVYYNTENNRRRAQSVSARDNTVNLGGLTASTNYFIWVTATRDGNEGDASAPIQVRTADPPRQGGRPGR